MRVTNEHIEAEIICAASRGCSGCIRENTDCSNITETNIDAFLDLKESRDLIKEMRLFLSTIQYDGCSDEIKADELIEKSKEYAE